MTKAQLRTQYKELRLELTAAQFLAQNKQIIANLIQQSWTAINYVHVYLPMENMREVDTWPFIDWIQEVYPAIVIVVSRSNFVDSSMSHYRFTNKAELEENKWGILEPHIGLPTIPVSAIDMVIVPLLVSDKEGNRVGYGKGFYDRFLGACRADCLKIGLSLFEPVGHIADVGPYDVPLDMLITADKTYTFKP